MKDLVFILAAILFIMALPCKRANAASNEPSSNSSNISSSTLKTSGGLDRVKKKLAIPAGNYVLQEGSKSEDCDDASLDLSYVTVGKNLTLTFGERIMFPHINETEFAEKTELQDKESCALVTNNLVSVSLIEQTITQTCTDKKQNFEAELSLSLDGNELTFSHSIKTEEDKKATKYDCFYNRAKGGS